MPASSFFAPTNEELLRNPEAPVVLSAPKRSEEADHWVGERVQVKMKTGMCCGTVRFNGRLSGLFLRKASAIL